MALLCKAFLLPPVANKHKGKSKHSDGLEELVGDA